ncbi:hypothetical protein Q6264_30740, partial [Klebsiella pneumoniae]|uniref:hypothetical protein n=1 Tax=Klebsiella pneumoniae TaxID=573 RepID=UPI002731826D
ETEHLVEVDDGNLIEDGMLFALEASSLMERRAARKESMDARLQAGADLSNEHEDFWIVWGEYNAETEMLVKKIHGAVEI